MSCRHCGYPRAHTYCGKCGGFQPTELRKHLFGTRNGICVDCGMHEVQAVAIGKNICLGPPLPPHLQMLQVLRAQIDRDTTHSDVERGGVTYTRRRVEMANERLRQAYRNMFVELTIDRWEWRNARCWQCHRDNPILVEKPEPQYFNPAKETYRDLHWERVIVNCKCGCQFKYPVMVV